MSYGQKQETILNLHKSYLNKRLNLKWYTKLILLDGKLSSILSFIFLGPLYSILGIIYLYIMNYKIKNLFIFGSNPDTAGLIQFTVLMLAFAGSVMTVMEFFPPILLTIRRFKPKTTVYEKEKYIKYLNFVILAFIILSIVIVVVISLFNDFFSLSFAFLIILLIINTSVVELLVPDYLWNIILSDTTGHYQKSNLIEIHKTQNFSSYETIVSLENNQKSFFFEKKIINGNEKEIVSIIKGITVKDVKNIIKYLIIIIVFEIFAMPFYPKSNLSNILYSLSFLVLTVYTLYELYVLTIKRKKIFSKRQINLDIHIYSQKLLDMKIIIERLGYHDFKEYNQYLFWEPSGFLYFIDKIKIELDKEYLIQVNDKNVRFNISKKYLETELGGFIPKRIEIIMFE